MIDGAMPRAFNGAALIWFSQVAGLAWFGIPDTQNSVLPHDINPADRIAGHGPPGRTAKGATSSAMEEGSAHLRQVEARTHWRHIERVRWPTERFPLSTLRIMICGFP